MLFIFICVFRLFTTLKECGKPFGFVGQISCRQTRVNRWAKGPSLAGLDCHIGAENFDEKVDPVTIDIEPAY
jgi:hypothetical protein